MTLIFIPNGRGCPRPGKGSCQYRDQPALPAAVGRWLAGVRAVRTSEVGSVISHEGCDIQRLECVGTAQSIATAFAVARPGSTVGIVGVPHGQVPFAETFFRNVGWRGGPAPARIYLPDLLGDVLDGVINPGRVFDYETDLDHIADAYRAMDERRAIKSLVRAGSL